MKIRHLLVHALVMMCIGSLDAGTNPVKPIVIPQWKILGPFPAALQEPAIDHLKAYGGESRIQPTSEQVFQSPYVNQSALHWIEIEADSAEVDIHFAQVHWDLLVKSVGQMAAVAHTYAYAEWTMEEETSALIETKHIAEFFLNGVSQFGEVYGYENNKIPVRLKKGKNQVLLKIGSFADPAFKFQIFPTKKSLEILDDWTFPDILSDETQDLALGITLANTTTDWLRNFEISLVDEFGFELKNVSLRFPIAPLSVLKIPLILKPTHPLASTESKIPLKFRVTSHKETLAESSVSLSVFKNRFEQKRSFISALDGSVQYYSVLYPKNYDPRQAYSLILSLHGANVEAKTQITTYSQKDWAFVIAPTNRRPHGFAWQGLGRLDALEVLREAQKAFKIDSRKIYVAGHSMGGQGTWYLGLHSPSLFAGLAPAAGWTDFQMYSPTFLQRSERYTDPQILAVRNRALMDADNPYFLQNALHLPVFITQAELDEVVPAIHSRFYIEGLDLLHLNWKYREIPTDKHWCDQPLVEARGFDCVDHPDQWNFLKTFSLDSFPEKISFRTFDLSAAAEAYWAKIERQTRAFSSTELKAEVTTKQIQIETTNVSRLSLDLPKKWLNRPIYWNGRRQGLNKKSGVQLDEFPVSAKKSFERNATNYGSLTQVFAKPFVIVYGTKGSPEDVATLLHNARLLSNRVWRTANGFGPILSDQEITTEIFKKYNLILFGSPKRNSIVGRIANKLPLHMVDETLVFNRHPMKFSAKDLALMSVSPNPYYRSNLVAIFAGTTSRAETFARYFRPLFERLGAGIPDFLVFDERVSELGWGGVRIAGFFSNDWSLKDKDFAISATPMSQF